MSASELRRAAALMRERAEAATPGPWFYVPSDATFNPSVGTVPAEGASWLETEEWIAESNPRGQHTARHIASWHPAVALAVADWLDDEAVAHEKYVDEAVRVRSIRTAYADSRASHALAIARAYIGT